MIEKLTKEQEEMLPAYRSEMLAHGRSTQPSDRKTTEEAISFFYSKIGKPSPKFFWFDGPFTGLIAIELLKQHWPELQKQKNLRANLRDNLRDNLWDNLWDNLGDNLWANLRDNLVDNLVDNLRDNLWANASKCFWGQHEIAWQAFYDFGNIIGVQYKDEHRKLLTAWLSIGKSTGWWCAFDGVCFCFERPSVLNLDDQGRLHSITAAAMGFRDTYSIYAVHGVRVPEYVILRPAEITVEKIDAETNAEIRRVMIERYGLAKFLIDGDSKEIHRDDFGILYRREIAGDEPLLMVKVANSTPEPDGSFKDYFIRVDPRCRPLLADNKFGEPQELTAQNAVAASFGKRGNEYAPLVET